MCPMLPSTKGASVLRMLDNFMGKEDFRIGVRDFLRKFQYGNAVTSDLWRHLEEASTDKLNISSIMNTWTKQMGYPVLNIKRLQSVREGEEVGTSFLHSLPSSVQFLPV